MPWLCVWGVLCIHLMRLIVSPPLNRTLVPFHHTGSERRMGGARAHRQAPSRRRALPGRGVCGSCATGGQGAPIGVPGQPLMSAGGIFLAG